MILQPVDYEPPFFRSCTEEEARHPWTKSPLKMEVGNVNSKHFVLALKVRDEELWKLLWLVLVHHNPGMFLIFDYLTGKKRAWSLWGWKWWYARWWSKLRRRFFSKGGVFRFRQWGEVTTLYFILTNFSITYNTNFELPRKHIICFRITYQKEINT